MNFIALPHEDFLLILFDHWLILMLTFRFRILIVNTLQLNVYFHSKLWKSSRKNLIVDKLQDVELVFLFLLLQRVGENIFLHIVWISFCLSDKNKEIKNIQMTIERTLIEQAVWINSSANSSERYFRGNVTRKNLITPSKSRDNKSFWLH